MFILRHQQGLPPFLSHRHGNDLVRQIACLLGGHRFELARQRHAVLCLALDPKFNRHVFRCLRHAVHAILGLHERIDEPPANGGVIHGVLPPKRSFHFGHHKGCAAHAFHATRNHQPGLPGHDRTGGRTHRIQPRATQPVQGGTWHFEWQARQQAAHAGHISVVLTRLIGAAIQHIVHHLPVHARVALHERLDRQRTQVVSANTAQGATITTKWGANRVANEGM